MSAIHPVDSPVPFPSEGFEAVTRKRRAGVDLDAYWVRSWLQLNMGGEWEKRRRLMDKWV